MTVPVSIAALLFAISLPVPGAGPWRPVEGHMMTRWAKQVTPERAWSEYPRPHMVRQEWKNLNGLWSYAISPESAPAPQSYEGEILVPFCVESALSGVKKTVGPDKRLWYRRTFTVPASWKGQRVLVHFGAVDWEATVWVNGKSAGTHRGGYDPFSFDITESLKADGEQELVVGVWDPTDTGAQARGKQVSEPQGIWYTPVTGIWQTVWLEPAPPVSVARLRPTPDIDAGLLHLTVETRGEAAGHRIRAAAFDGSAKAGEASGDAGRPLAIRVPRPKLWSPESPHLYDLTVTLERDGKAVDEVKSYFGMRKIGLGKDRHGRLRIELNNKPYFHIGPLDQGWWPDGLYTAPNEEAMRYDIEITRQLGFNMARKHVKVEPARWYYDCDRLGLLVWQDMPNGHLHGAGPDNLRVAPADAKDAKRPPESARQFETEMKALVDNFRHFPSIVMWVPFNEGWGQYDTARIARLVKQWDPSRLVNAPSGWTDRGVGDVYDTHMYPGPGMEDPGPGRATVLGEFGGLGWPVDGHLWWNKRNWGYRTYHSREELNRNYREVVGNVWGLLGHGLSAAIYTQTTDVEGEVNGLMTYDREVVKFDAAELRRLHGRLYRPAPEARVLARTSENQPQTWSYTQTEPAAGWAKPGFQDSGWQRGAGPFQSGDDPLFPTGTKWAEGPIWARRTFTAAAAPANLWLEIYQAVDSGTVFLNGEPILELHAETETRRHYQHMDAGSHARLLRRGENVLAIQGVRKQGRRGIDVGLYALEEAPGRK